MEQDSEAPVEINFEGLLKIINELNQVFGNIESAIRFYLDLMSHTKVEMNYKLSDLIKIYDKGEQKFTPYFTTEAEEKIRAVININI